MTAVFLVVIVVCGVALGAWIAPTEANGGFAEPAAVLAFASLAAVVIERLIEGLFTALSGPLGQWWPMSSIKKEFDTFEKETESALTSVLEKTEKALERAKSVAGEGTERFENLQAAHSRLNAEAESLSAQFEDARAKLAPGSARLQRAATISRAAHTALAEALEATGDTVSDAHALLQRTSATADRALLIIGSFHDNPARRLASLGLGAAFGSIIAGGVGLNIFSATLATGATADDVWVPQWLLGGLGVALTGIVIGLGSAPTHEVIKALQRYKQGRTAPEPVMRLAPSVSTTRAVSTTPTAPTVITLPAFLDAPSVEAEIATEAPAGAQPKRSRPVPTPGEPSILPRPAVGPSVVMIRRTD